MLLYVDDNVSGGFLIENSDNKLVHSPSLPPLSSQPTSVICGLDVCRELDKSYCKYIIQSQ